MILITSKVYLEVNKKKIAQKKISFTEKQICSGKLVKVVPSSYKVVLPYSIFFNDYKADLLQSHQANSRHTEKTEATKVTIQERIEDEDLITNSRRDNQEFSAKRF